MSEKNLVIWDAVKHPPQEALSKIQGGRLSGNTNISPQWRYKIMTEQFGVIGFGWYFEYVKIWIEEGSDDQKVMLVDLNLFIKVGDDWSKPIPGSGGSFLVDKESKGLYTNDEALKMATTDALGTAMKLIGVGADIYLGMHDGTKYRKKNEEPNGGSNDYGAPTVPFNRNDIIQFGKFSANGDSKTKKAWKDLSDKYLAILHNKVTGGYKAFIEAEIQARKDEADPPPEEKEEVKEKVETPVEKKKKVGMINPGDPNDDFDRNEMIQFGKYEGKKAWKDLSDKYLKTLSEKIEGGYLDFVKQEIEFRENPPEEKEEKVLTKEEVQKMNIEHQKKKIQAAKEKAEKATEDAKKKVQEKYHKDDETPSAETEECDPEMRKEILTMIKNLVKKGHISRTPKKGQEISTADAWDKIAKTENNPIKFHTFYWKVTFATLVCKASDSNLINRNTKLGYFKVLRDDKTKISQLEPLMAEVKALFEEQDSDSI